MKRRASRDRLTLSIAALALFGCSPCVKQAADDKSAPSSSAIGATDDRPSPSHDLFAAPYRCHVPAGGV